MNCDKTTTDPISADMTVLDIVARWPKTQDVFRSYDESAGECIMCQALFETVREVSRRYGLDEGGLVGKLNTAALRNGNAPNTP